MSRLFLSLALAGSLLACGSLESPERLSQLLVLATAVLGENEDGSPKPLPARAGILTREGDEWQYRFFEDPDSNVFHKVMPYGTEGLLTLGGSKAAVKLWRPDGKAETLWEAEFGGKFSRMRDAEIGDIYGDGKLSIAVGTHDQGVVAVLRPDGTGKFSVEERIGGCIRSSVRDLEAMEATDRFWNLTNGLLSKKEGPPPRRVGAGMVRPPVSRRERA